MEKVDLFLVKGPNFEACETKDWIIQSQGRFVIALLDVITLKQYEKDGVIVAYSIDNEDTLTHAEAVFMRDWMKREAGWAEEEITR